MKLLTTALAATIFCGTAFAASSSTTGSVTPAAASTPAVTSTATTTATITLTPMNQTTLVATGTITRAPGSMDRLAVQWSSPNNLQAGGCHNSMHKIKLKATTFKSSRTPWYQDSNGAAVGCQGVWTAAVVDKITGKTLASAQYTVSPAKM
jgi:hypothetical protein